MWTQAFFHSSWSSMSTKVDQVLNTVPEGSAPFPESPFVIYGAGNCGRDVCRVLKASGHEVAAFIDVKAEAIIEVDGVPCFSPESADALEYAALPVILAIFNNAADTGAIEAMLREHGFLRIVSYYMFFERFPEKVVSRFWLAPRSTYPLKRAELNSAFQMFRDEKSRSIFLETLKLRTTFDLQLLRAPDPSHQYLPEDLPAPKCPMRLVDGGCYVGDTVEAIRAHGFEIEAAACFEPDPRNFSRLRDLAERQLGGIRELCLFPCGLGESTAMHRFFAGQDAASTITEHGESVIQVVALDDVLPNFAPTLFKLDVEGAERASLLGASKIIERFRPAIAVCLYHRPEDLWELPLLLRKLAPNYEFAVRYHGFNGFEIVLYAMPL
jgi:FkbM family methyltransferase